MKRRPLSHSKMMTDAEIAAMLDAADLDALAAKDRAKREKFLNAPENAEKVARLRARLDLCVKLCALRRKAKLTQKQVAERMHTRQPYIADLERGRKNATVDTLHAYAAACGGRLAIQFV